MINIDFGPLLLQVEVLILRGEFAPHTALCQCVSGWYWNTQDLLPLML